MTGLRPTLAGRYTMGAAPPWPLRQCQKPTERRTAGRVSALLMGDGGNTEAESIAAVKSHSGRMTPPGQRVCDDRDTDKWRAA